MASSNDLSRWHHQGFSNRWFRIFIISKTSQEEVWRFLFWVKRFFFIHTWYWILDSKSYIFISFFSFLSFLIDRLFYYDKFGVFYKDTLVYLTTDPERDVVKQKIDDPLNVPRHLPKTRIPNQHTGAEIIGVHVGHYFWIFGGKSWHDYNVHTIVHIKSSLWSLSRDVWISAQQARNTRGLD